MRVIGIDPGSIKTGFAVLNFKAQSIELLASGSIILDPDLRLHERLRELAQDLEKIFTKHKPEEMALESIFFAKNARSSLQLGQARGIALLKAAEARAEVFEYAPTEVKQCVCGHGRASKEQIQKMIRLLLKLPSSYKFISADQADAVAIALTHAQLKGLKTNDRTSFWQTTL